MTSILFTDFAEGLELTDESEERFLASGVSWQQYSAFLARLGDSSRYRVTYLDGIIEIMSPSRRHEVSAESIADLLQEYFKETRTPYYPLGSTTFRKQEKRGGKEPDKSYCIGTEKEFPDLVIEVVVTSGGIDSLEVYKRLGIREVWYWEDDQFSLYHLRGDEYEEISQSELLPDLDVSLLAEYVLMSDPLQAALGFRQRIRELTDRR